MFTDFDLAELKRIPEIAFYFRHPLRHDDFHELREPGGDQRLLGYVTAKPLDGKLTDLGKVDRSVGFNGEIAVIFLKCPLEMPDCAQLLFTHIAPSLITGPDGKHNWPAIRAAADEAINRDTPHAKRWGHLEEA